MKYALIATAILFSSPALAQQAPEKTYQLTVSTADLAIIAQGLGEVASKLANPVIVKLNAQINAADAPKPVPPKDAPKP